MAAVPSEEQQRSMALVELIKRAIAHREALLKEAGCRGARAEARTEREEALLAKAKATLHETQLQQRHGEVAACRSERSSSMHVYAPRASENWYLYSRPVRARWRTGRHCSVHLSWPPSRPRRPWP